MGKMNISNETKCNFLSSINFRLFNHIKGSSINICDFLKSHFLLEAVVVILCAGRQNIAAPLHTHTHTHTHMYVTCV
jgi:hypothetical protein